MKNLKVKAPLFTRRLVADIGGTHARFALVGDNGVPERPLTLSTRDYSSLEAAYSEYLKLSGNPAVLEAAIAIAGTVEDDWVKMTNHSWEFSITEICRKFKLKSLFVKNDFTALALAIPFLDRSDYSQVGGGNVLDKSPVAVLGPGTGLGVSGLLYCNEQWVALASEGGHVSLSPATERELEILKVCLARFPHVSAELLVSGPGLQIILQTLYEIDDVPQGERSTCSSPEITANAISRADQYCQETVDIFCGLLGTIAGNLALTIGAKGGVYIGGGIIPKLGSYFNRSPFRNHFEAKGRFSGYLKEIPVFVIRSEHAALTGLTRFFDEV